MIVERNIFYIFCKTTSVIRVCCFLWGLNGYYYDAGYDDYIENECGDSNVYRT